MNKVLHNIT